MIRKKKAYGLLPKAVTLVAAFVVLGGAFCVSAQRSACAAEAVPGHDEASAQTNAERTQRATDAKEAAGEPNRIIAIDRRQQNVPYKLTPDTVGPGGLWLVVYKSPVLTAMLRRDMAMRGYKLANSVQEATSWMTVVTAMTLEAKGRMLNIDVPAIVEKNAREDADLQHALASADINKNFVLPLDGWGTRIGNNVGGPSQAMSIFAIGNFFEATGIAAKFNEWTVGDARGICLVKLIGMACPEFDATVHHTKLTVFFRPMNATREQSQKAEVMAANYIPKADIGLALLMTWTDFHRALNGKEIGNCNDKKPENCVPEVFVADANAEAN